MPGVRIGVYRMTGAPSSEEVDKVVLWARQRVGDGYGWAQLARKGFQLLLNLHPEPERFIPSPNDLIVRTEGIELVFLI